MKISNLAFLALTSIGHVINASHSEEYNQEKMDSYMHMMHPETRNLRRHLQACNLAYDGHINGAITNGEITCQPSVDQPCEWDFWKVDLIAGVNYEIRVVRSDCGMDPALTLLKGTDMGAPLVAFGASRCSSFGTAMTFLDCADDNTDIPDVCRPLYDSEPFFAYFDPTINWIPDESTWYTLAVQNFIPNTADGDQPCPIDGDHDYQIIITPPPPSPRHGGVYEDPHIKLWNGTWIDYHGECDLVQLDAPSFEKDLPLSIHIRTTIRYFYSYIEAAVLKIGDDTLEVASWGEYLLNGVEGALLDGEQVGTIGGFPIHYHRVNEKQVKYDVIISDEETITMSAFKDMVSVSIDTVGSHRFDDSRGIMGSIDGTMLARDGKTVLNDPYDFGAEWQVTEDEPMLFRTARHPQAPQRCLQSDRASAEAALRRLGENGVTRGEAETACSNVPKDHREACITDVMAVGDIDIATAGAY